MTLKRRMLRALITGALAVTAAVTGAGAAGVAQPTPSGHDSVVVVAHPDDPEGSGGAGNGQP